jgi:superfamily II DNA or RNA helicase
VRRENSKKWLIAGVFRRGEARLEADVPAVAAPGVLIAAQRVAPLAEDTPFEWLAHFRQTGGIAVPQSDLDEALAALLCSPGVPPLEVPEELRYQEVALRPQPQLRISNSQEKYSNSRRLRGELAFDYEGRLVAAVEKTAGFYDVAARRFLRRDGCEEKAAHELLEELGLKFYPTIYGQPPYWDFAPTKLPRIVRALVEAGWHIEAEGKIFRRPGAFQMQVSTGVDWFELHGGVDYGDTTAKLPELLEALRRGDNMVRLDDGTYGVLPEEWLQRFGTLARLGTLAEGHVRFRASQAGLLDALLASQPEATCDAAFERLRHELAEFQGVAAAPQPEGFVGVLRDYQREGLGWMDFLRRFSFGGCLADDMGVGKTAQVLALLEGRRHARAGGQPLQPSLVVVPKSLVFNWKQEAERFAPQLRVLDYTGSARSGSSFDDYDLILTTYGTLRRDAIRLKDIEFDYVVLDEAQAIKNANTDSAKAVRLLRGTHRLALSGTPVENHLGELWSLFEFLNPGMLGAASVFKLAGGSARQPDEETRRLLAHALRPFILRRTKAQVARELPPKVEQTIFCELEPAQRKLYNELRQHYRQALLQRIEVEGLEKSKIQVLEALLRLRQASCHPGLIDARRSHEPSAKLDMLLEQLREVLDEGHKALVFSQFVSLLTIVRDRLDHEGIAYEYLDGATHDRQRPVERFQNDPSCRLFLISLKAGGLGLNLTAADYVFLLDPWWNPAVETQAIDRAHRIGQTQQVFAYRLIAQDTVEEKVLELQKNKRDLADAIIGEDNSLIRNLAREDLELLLS